MSPTTGAISLVVSLSLKEGEKGGKNEDDVRRGYMKEGHHFHEDCLDYEMSKETGYMLTVAEAGMSPHMSLHIWEERGRCNAGVCVLFHSFQIVQSKC